ncbi:MAG: hypothetical protein ACFFEN_04985, partial [Candidatus Thorarchaeota archaeon]
MTSYRKSLIFIGISLILFFLTRLALVILYHSQFANLAGTDLIMGFIEGIRFDLASTIVFLSIPLLLMNLPGKFIQNRIVQSLFSW